MINLNDLDNFLEKEEAKIVLNKAINRSIKHHKKKKEVKIFLKNRDRLTNEIFESIKDGSWKKWIKYRQLKKTNTSNNKTREIDSPSFYTRILQNFMLEILEPIYYSKDPGSGLNCKKGRGITALNKKGSVVKKIKHCYFDLPEYTYYLKIDQRKCYKHITKKLVRKSLKKLISCKWLIDFSVEVSFRPGTNYLPIGTPSSPFIHHVIMLPFDYYVKTMTNFHVRYADDNFLAFHTKEEAHSAKWRIMNYWWYNLGIRAKTKTTIIAPINEKPIDFCGYTFHRNTKIVSTKNTNFNKCIHNKGYVGIRNSTLHRVMNCKTLESWSSYFGTILVTDLSKSIINYKSNMPSLKDINKKCGKIRIKGLESVLLQDLKNYSVLFDVLRYTLNPKAGDENEIESVVFTFIVKNSESDKLSRNSLKLCKTTSPNIVNFFLSVEKNYSNEECIKSGESLVDIKDSRRIIDLVVDKKPSVGYFFEDTIEYAEKIENGVYIYNENQTEVTDTNDNNLINNPFDHD